MMKRRDIAVSLCGVLMLMIAGSMATVEPRAAETKAAPPIGAAKPVSKPAPPAAPPPPSPTIYHQVGKPDPFHPFIETDLALQKKLEADLKKKATVKAAVKERPKLPLQQAEIEQLRLAAIGSIDGRYSAIVEHLSTKQFYPLFVETKIGPNEGRVVEILPDRVIVEQRIEDPNLKDKKAQVRRIPPMMLRKEE